MNRIPSGKRTMGSVIAGLVLVASAGASHAQQAAGAAASPVTVKVPPALMAKANAPKPAANATKQTSIGKGKLKVNTANSPSDDDSFWAEQVDVDGNGDVEDVNLIWDDEDKVLYFSDENDSITCANGGVVTADLVIGINGQGNSRNRPAGSGFYLVSLDEGECKIQSAGLYGCKFDANGKVTACGVAVLDEKNDDLLIATASK